MRIGDRDTLPGLLRDQNVRLNRMGRVNRTQAQPPDMSDEVAALQAEVACLRERLDCVYRWIRGELHDPT